MRALSTVSLLVGASLTSYLKLDQDCSGDSRDPSVD